MNGEGEDQSTDSTIMPPEVMRAQQVGVVPKAEFVAPPPAPAYTGLPTLSGTATRFGGPNDRAAYASAKAAALKAGKTPQQAEEAGLNAGDNGIGSAALGSVDTANAYGIAVPTKTMEKYYGGSHLHPSTTANWRTARADVMVNGVTYHNMPIVDVGPGDESVGKGNVTDFAHYLANGVMGTTNEQTSADNVQVKLLPPGSGPDYTTHREAFNAEQAYFAKHYFGNNPDAQIIGAPDTPLSSPDIVRPPASQNPQGFAKGGMVLPMPEAEEPDEDSSLGKHLGGSLGAVNA
jgi:hypothetical protein